MEIIKIIEKIIENSLKELKIELPENNKIEITHPDILKHGDYTTNVALVLSRIMSKNPRDIAEDIIKNIKDENIEKVEIAGAGFINFYLSKDFYLNNLINKEIVKKKETNKFLVEHSSPNLFKPFHIGHLVNNAIGQSLGNIIETFGNNVTWLSFPSDVSPGIAKTVWGIKDKNIQNKLDLKKIGEAYAWGVKNYDENDDLKIEINEINKKIYNNLEEIISDDCGKIEDEDLKIYIDGRKISEDYFKKLTKKLGSKFDKFIYESEAEIVGKKYIFDNLEKAFIESEKAIVFEGSKYGLYDNVFINSDGFATYAGKDIGLLKIKFDNYDFDKSITVTDVEQKQHFQVVKKAAEILNKEWSDKSEYLQHGRLKFAGGVKISSRLGNVPVADDLIEKVKQNILEKMEDRGFSSGELEDISNKLAIASLKYSILKVKAGKNIMFDIEKDTDPKGNSAPYLLYSLVRAKSILRKSKDIKIKNDIIKLKKSDIVDLERVMYRFEEEVVESYKYFSSHHIANYLYQIASEFNSFYKNNKILDEENKDLKYNLLIIKKYISVLEKGLNLLGIEFVEKM